jgi:hypothetical protein
LSQTEPASTAITTRTTRPKNNNTHRTKINSNSDSSNHNSNSNSNDDNDKKKATDKTKTYRNKIGKHDEKCTATIARSKGKTFKNPKQKVDLQLQNIANAAQQGLD